MPSEHHRAPPSPPRVAQRMGTPIPALRSPAQEMTELRGSPSHGLSLVPVYSDSPCLPVQTLRLVDMRAF